MSDRTTIPPRAVTIYRIDERVHCPSGHAFRERSGIMPHAWLRCAVRVHDRDGGSRDCNEYVYVVNLGRGYLGVCEIDWRAANHLERLQMSMHEAAEFLQLPWRQEERPTTTEGE